MMASTAPSRTPAFRALARHQRLAGLQALEEDAELLPDGLEEGDQSRVRLADPAPEALDHGVHPPAHQDREGDPVPKADPPRHRQPQEVVVGDEVVDPGRFVGLPDAAGQPGADLQAQAHARVAPRLEPGARPHRGAAQPPRGTLPADDPYRGRLPAKPDAEILEE